MSWNFYKWLLFAVWLAAAAANVAEIRCGFLTNHAADLALPAWLYIVLRMQTADGRRSQLLPWAGRSAGVTAGMIFAGATATEAWQYFWPEGIFAGTFDPLDIVAFGVGVSACYLAEQRWPLARQ
jgi:hypothetical protein